MERTNDGDRPRQEEDPVENRGTGRPTGTGQQEEQPDTQQTRLATSQSQVRNETIVDSIANGQ